ncbi:MAG TPA: hypothetical protein VFP84_30555 [Kofleriaceae bacterium]|nr:hypothetical protein [Kofleriaceae bacterium]
MHRLRRAALPLVLLAAVAAIFGATVDDSSADLENLVFTSRTDHIRLIVPRGWRASEQPSYPAGANKSTVLNGLLLWMAHSQPQGQIVLTGEALTHAMYCSWPVACRTSGENLAWKYACAIRDKLSKLKLKVDEIQAGPKDNEAAGLPSVWFEYQDGKHFLRQAIAFSTDRAFSLVLSAPNSEARATHTRAFEQALRTMQLIDLDDSEPASAATPAAASAGPGDVDAISGSVAHGTRDAGVADAAIIDAGVAFESPPPPKPDPVGPCK